MDEQQQRLAEELLFTGEKKPSLAKMLYFGLFDSERAFPFPQVSVEEKEQVDCLVKQVQEFASKQINGKEIDQQAAIPDAVIQGLGKLGILGLTIPKEYGGLGMSQYAYCQVIEVIAQYCGSTALFINAHQSIGLKALLLFGTEAQKRRWLPPLARGEQLAAFSLTEPNAGSDASGVETRATYDPEKNVYRLRGKKQWTTNGSIAQVLTVMAKTEIETATGKQDKITAFLVTPDMPGFKVTAPALEKVGMRGTRTSNLEFQDVEVPAENILGPIGGGLKVCLTVLDYGRTTFGATCTGGAKLLLEKAIFHATHRYQFKRSLASFPLVKKKLATMAGLVYAMDAATYLTAGMVDSGASEFMLEAAMLKVFTSDSLWTILYETMQIYGGRSFFTDEPFERMMRDARLNMIGEGSNEVLRVFIGVVGMRDVGMQFKGVLEALSNPIDNFSIIKDFSKQVMHRFSQPKIPIRSPLLKDESRQLGAAIRRFGIAIVRLLARHKENIVEKQLDLDRIATSAMAIYTLTAALSKLDSDLQENQEQFKRDTEVVKLYCLQAFALIDQSLESLFKDNADEAIERVADLLV